MLEKDNLPPAASLSVDARHDAVLHAGHVVLVVRAVLLEALLLVAVRAVDQQDREERRVEERQRPVDQGVRQQAPGPGRRELEGVLEVARDAPPARIVSRHPRPVIDCLVGWLAGWSVGRLGA